MIVKYQLAKAKQLVKKCFFPQFYAHDKFPNHPAVYYKTAIGNYYLPADAPYDYIATEMRKGKIFEPEIVQTAKQYIKPGTAIIDIGANFGQMALLFSAFTGKNGQVYAFEANDYVYHILLKNIEANAITNIRPWLRAVYNKSHENLVFTEIDFVKWSSYGSYGLNPKATKGKPVKTVAIDDIDFALPVSFIKIDIQGADLFALQGAAKTIVNNKAAVLFEYEEQFQEQFNTSFNDYVEFVKDINYKFEKTINSINYLIVPDKKTQYVITNDFFHKKTEIYSNKLCKFLQNADEINNASLFLQQNGLFAHQLECKNWDIANIVPQIRSGRFLDMGSSDSFILKNLNYTKFQGELHGIDLRTPNVPLPDVKYKVGDLMNTGYPDNYFSNITCLSVIEHDVDFEKLAIEASRILEKKGRFFVTFDYWEPKINTHNTMLFGLKWNILDKNAVEHLMNAMTAHKLQLVEPLDWTLDKPVIDYYYGSPDKKYKYTFGLLVFEKME